MTTDINKTRSITIATFTSLAIVPILLLTTLTPIWIFQFERYAVYDNFSPSYSNAEINDQFSSVIVFLLSPIKTDLDKQFFSFEDITHLNDVRNIILGLEFLVVISLLFLISRWTDLRQHWAEILKFSATTLGNYLLILIIIAILSAFFWDEGFRLFHQVFFPFNDYWQLNPETSNLIKYFLNPIFQETFVIYVIIVAAETLTLSKLQYLWKKKRLIDQS